MILLTDEELNIICQFLTEYPPPFYPSVSAFTSDLYSTGCRPEELLDLSLWTDSIITPEAFTLQPLKGNFTREILRAVMSDNFKTAYEGDYQPYQNLSLRQLEYSMKQIYPVARIFAETKIIVAYPFRYNKVRQLVAAGYTQNQISEIFGWVSPTINATYTHQALYYSGGSIPAETYFIISSDNSILVDFTQDKIISQ